MDDGGAAKLWNNVGETVEDNYTMTGGSGSGMVLRIELEGTAGSGGPNNTRLRVKQVISAGTGYQSGDNVNFNLLEEPMKVLVHIIYLLLPSDLPL